MVFQSTKKKILDNLIDVKKDGSFRLNQDYFNYATGLRMTNKKFNKLFECEPRNPEKEELKQIQNIQKFIIKLEFGYKNSLYF